MTPEVKLPKSLSSRNTKKLSLEPDRPYNDDGQDSGFVSTTLERATKCRSATVGTFSESARQPLLSRRSEASIYTVGSKRSALDGDSGLRLSLQTEQLGSGKTTWLLPKKPLAAAATTEFVTEQTIYNTPVYTQGPLLVVPPKIYLYSAPTLEEVRSFDVVVNVAQETKDYRKELEERGIQVEYYHVLWTHQSKIAGDLTRLTNIIHEANLANKKVLVHCQCGVSRSASLIVAYIMKYHQLGLNEAYEHLKSIAEDISPNMGLIFQLMEWDEQMKAESHAEETESTFDNT